MEAPISHTPHRPSPALPPRGPLRASYLLRLAAHAAGGESWRGEQHGAAGGQQPFSERWPCPRAGRARKRLRLSPEVATRSLLEAVDYSFYQSIDDVSDEYLWAERLRPKLDYLSPEQLEKVQEALHLAYDSHLGQVRKSGEPFVTHPVEVTRILAELQMDHESLVGGLLHDTVEDTSAVSFEEIQVWFGRSVRQIVEGETKFSKVSLAACEDKAEIAARDLQQLFLAMTQEVRIIIVKLADRLHNMRTLGSMPPHKQTLIARETLLVFAPLARLLGLYSVKEELETLAFQYSDPEAHARVARRLDLLAASQGPVVLRAKEHLRELLEESSLLKPHVHTFEIHTLQKSPYSVHRKVRESGRRLDEVVDVAQLRIVLHPYPRNEPGVPEYLWRQQLCYQVLGLIHSSWAPIPGQLKDYISLPKSNGYRALHSTVQPLGLEPLFPLELQIRTSEMHRLAEYAESWLTPVPPTSAPGGGHVEEDALPPLARALPPRGRSGVGDLVRHVRQLQRIWSGDVGRSLGGPQVNGTHVAPEHPPLPAAAAAPPDQPKDPAANGVDVAAPAAISPAAGAPAANGVAHHPPGGELYTIANQAVREADLGTFRMDPSSLTRRINWLHSIRTWQAEFLHNLTATEFVDCVCDDLLAPCVFVYTMSGQVMRLPKGATPVDFAYHVHTEVGNTMIGAKVNGRWVPPSYALHNADVVEIIKYPNVNVRLSVQRHRDWLQNAKTKSARHKLQKYLRDNAGVAVGLAEEAGAHEAPARGRQRPHRRVALDVACSDRAGLLAETARVIAQHGHNVLAHSGSSGSMRYELEGDPALAPAMLAAMAAVPSIKGVQRAAPPSPPPASSSASSASQPAPSSPLPASQPAPSSPPPASPPAPPSQPAPGATPAWSPAEASQSAAQPPQDAGAG